MKNEAVFLSQPSPKPGKVVVIEMMEKWIVHENHAEWFPILADIKLRGEAGKKKYGSYLMSHNGRNGWLDLYQELCDAIVYSSQIVMELADNQEPGGEELGQSIEALMLIAEFVRGELVSQGVLDE